jgi:hypothetical protein
VHEITLRAVGKLTLGSEGLAACVALLALSDDADAEVARSEQSSVAAPGFGDGRTVAMTVNGDTRFDIELRRQ